MHGASATSGPKLAGVLGFFDGTDALIQAMKQVRDARYKSFDAFTPYPVHGLEQAQGLKRSPLPWVTFIMGMTGFATAFGLQYWTSVVDWPLNVGGKPLNSWPAFVPILFELTVLFAGVSTALALFAICGLPNTSRRSFDSSLTRDRFAILIEAPKSEFEEEEDEGKGFKKFDSEEAHAFLQKTGAKEVRKVFEEGWF